VAPGPNSASDAADNGFLTLAEIYELDLNACELAILSACQTNYGPEQEGEGVWGLSRGFLVAGARRVVASNWLVDDEAAAHLMSYFCGNVAKTSKTTSPGNDTAQPDYAVAMQLAKREVRKKEKWRSPYYWATFVLVGPN
jgi:CHAT domain-containing protein